MSERKWTPEQSQAIFAHWINEEKTKRGNILVNAAAGSGKTAVLVERIIKKLMPEDGSAGVGIDKLLVVTFTNAAAAEMQERVGDALSKKLTEAVTAGDYKSRRLLKKQIALLPFSDITTIDAFCLKTIRNHFHLLNINPDFSIMDSGELELMKADAVDLLFEELYEENHQGFFDLLSMYTDGRDDSAVAEKILQIYRFTRAFPDPRAWLVEKCGMFKTPEKWLEPAEKEAKAKIQKAFYKLKTAADIMVKEVLGETADTEAVIQAMPPRAENEMYLAWGTYYTAVYEEYFRTKEMLGSDWDRRAELLSSPFIKLNKKAVFVDKERQIKDKDLKAEIKNLRDMAKADIGEAKRLAGMPAEKLLSTMTDKLYKPVSALAELTLRFEEIYLGMKEKKNVLEFSDVEHLCLKLFSDFSDVREEFRNKYEEILMDEYQDTNRLQEEIFSKISTGDNLFMVGDMKQSIYRFRSSDPEIFKEKSDLYIKDSHAENRKIVLGKNFRSRREVLDSVNDIFGLIMTERAGGIDYDEDQRLNLGDTSYRQENEDYRSELIVIEEKGANSEVVIDKARLEARAIAERILKLREEGFLVRSFEESPVLDPATGEVRRQKVEKYRELQNRDITILMSSYKGVADIFADELSKAGIACYAENDGYFERNEIKLVLALLKVIGNPYQDIPLLGVLRSPIGGFTDDDLVNIRLSGEGYIFSAMKIFAEQLEKGELEDAEIVKSAEKTADFLKRLEKWRGYVKYMPSDKLLWTLYEETEIYGFVGALYGKDEAQANLRLLFERAKKYEKSGYKGLFNFVRYISLLKKRSEDLSTAQPVTENHDVVRIMTIHKSKGLEFPVVFLAGAGKKFNMRDTSGNMLLHKDWGFGMEYIDYEKSIRTETLSKRVVARTIEEESISEEIRKLYVALTRAKEKLIVTATVGGKNKNDEGGVDTVIEKWQKTEIMTADEVLKSKTFIEWVGAAAVKNPENWKLVPIEYGRLGEGIYNIEESDTETEETEIDVSHILGYSYQYTDSADIPTKVSVSDLKNERRGEKSLTQLIRVPEFMKEETEVKGAARGTVIHYIMQNIPFADVMDTEYVAEFINRLFESGRLNEAEVRAVDVAAVADFYNSELGMRMRKSNKVYRERAFEMEISAKLVEDSFPEEESVILQGIIDCYFEEDGGFVLVDYKSDYYDDAEEIKQKYAKQLELYAEAVEKITKKVVKSKFLYLFFRNNVVEL